MGIAALTDIRTSFCFFKCYSTAPHNSVLFLQITGMHGRYFKNRHRYRQPFRARQKYLCLHGHSPSRSHNVPYYLLSSLKPFLKAMDEAAKFLVIYARATEPNTIASAQNRKCKFAREDIIALFRFLKQLHGVCANGRHIR